MKRKTVTSMVIQIMLVPLNALAAGEEGEKDRERRQAEEKQQGKPDVKVHRSFLVGRAYTEP